METCKMGLAASQARFLGLTSRKSDLEFQGQMINQKRTENADKTKGFIQKLAFIEESTDPAAYKIIELDIEQVHIIDRTLEIDLKNIDTHHNEVQTEIDAVTKVIDKNIDMTFKTFA